MRIGIVFLQLSLVWSQMTNVIGTSIVTAFSSFFSVFCYDQNLLYCRHYMGISLKAFEFFFC